MLSEAVKQRQKYDRIISELVTVMAYDQAQASELVASGIFDAYSTYIALQRINLLISQLGPEHGRAILEKRPDCMALRLSRLPHHLDLLIRDGHAETQARAILRSCLDLTSLSFEDFERVHEALKVLVPDAEQRRSLVSCKPEVYLLPPYYLRQKAGLEWSGDATGFYRSMKAEDDDYESEHVRNWAKAIKEALCRLNPDRGESNWRTLYRRHAWIFDGKGPGPHVLNEFAFWLDLRQVPSWPMRETRFLTRLCLKVKFHPLLRLSQEILRYRIAISRRYVLYDFLKHPDSLLLPWETLDPPELRYRVHEIEGRGYVNGLLPFAEIMVKPTRQEFLRSLDEATRRRDF